MPTLEARFKASSVTSALTASTVGGRGAQSGLATASISMMSELVVMLIRRGSSSALEHWLWWSSTICRMRDVASYPSISGIHRSIKTMSMGFISEADGCMDGPSPVGELLVEDEADR